MVTAFGYGLRHGIDWDHLAAITDLTSSQDDSRRSMVLAGLYAGGHAVVVFVLGVLAIAAGDRLPAGVDEAMGRMVGATLVVLGAWVFWSLARHGRDFRLRSRWMLVFAGLRRLRRRDKVTVEHEHDHGADHHPGTVPAAAVAEGGSRVQMVQATHAHAHRHLGTLPADPFGTYGKGTAFAVGALHGVGAETPTQVLLFVAAAGVAGTGGGLLMLGAFIAGMLTTNTAIAVASTFGFLQAGRNWALYVGLGVVIGAVSLVLGTLFLLGREDMLPTFFGG